MQPYINHKITNETNHISIDELVVLAVEFRFVVTFVVLNAPGAWETCRSTRRAPETDNEAVNKTVQKAVNKSVQAADKRHCMEQSQTIAESTQQLVADLKEPKKSNLASAAVRGVHTGCAPLVTINCTSSNKCGLRI